MLSFQRNMQLTEKVIFRWHKDDTDRRKIAQWRALSTLMPRSTLLLKEQHVRIRPLAARALWCSHTSPIAKLCSQTFASSRFKAMSSMTLGCLHVLPQYHFLHPRTEVKIMPTSWEIWEEEEVNKHITNTQYSVTEEKENEMRSHV